MFSHRPVPSGEAVWTGYGGRGAESLRLLPGFPIAEAGSHTVSRGHLGKGHPGKELGKGSFLDRWTSGCCFSTRRRPMDGGVYEAPSGLRLDQLPPSPFCRLALPPISLLRLSPARLAHSFLPSFLVTFPARFAPRPMIPSYPREFWLLGGTEHFLPRHSQSLPSSMFIPKKL